MPASWLQQVEEWFREPQVQSYGEGSEELVLQPVREMIEPHIPRMLYKLYAPEQYAIDFLEHGKTGMTSASAFNDPFDTVQKLDKKFIEDAIRREDIRALLSPIYKVLKDPVEAFKLPELGLLSEKNKSLYIASVLSEWNIEKVAYYLEHPDEYYSKDIAEYTECLRECQKEIVAHTYVSCFTTEITNMLMWSHYAKSHKGFAIGYDFSTEENKEARKILFPVLYSDKKLDVTIETHFVQSLTLSEERGYSIDRLIGIKSSLFKSPDWSYEKEWRIAKRDLENTCPYEELPLKASEIYYGSRISTEDFTKLHKIAEKQGLKEYKMNVDPYSDEFCLEIVEL